MSQLTTQHPEQPETTAETGFLERFVATPWFWVLVLMLVGAGLRFTNLGWDGEFMFHSDERNVIYSIDKINFIETDVLGPDGMPTRAKQKLLNLDPGFYVYGSLPVYIGRLAWMFGGTLGAFPSVDVAARWVSAMFNLLCIPMLFILGRTYFSSAVGLLGAAFFTFAVQHIQTSRYGTVESMLTFVGLLAVWSVHAILKRGSLRDYLLAGACLGLGMATKFSALSFMLPFALAHCCAIVYEHANEQQQLWQPTRWTRFAASVVLMLVIGYVGAPYQIHKWDRMVAAMNWEGGVVVGRIIPNYVYQFTGTKPYLYQIENLFWYHLGPLLAVAAIGGLLYCVARLAWTDEYLEGKLIAGWVPFLFVGGSFLLTLKDHIVAKNIYFGSLLSKGFTITREFIPQEHWSWRMALKFPYWNDVVLVGWLAIFFALSLLVARRRRPYDVVLLSWPLFYFGFTGAWRVKFMRYTLPVVPFFFLFGAKMLTDLRDFLDGLKPGREEQPSTDLPARSGWGSYAYQVLCGVIIGTSALYALAFQNVHAAPSSKIAAMNWIQQNVPSTSRVIAEAWDDVVPLINLPGSNISTIDFFENESIHKTRQVAKELSSADYIVLSSKRVFAPIFNQPGMYPNTMRYYKALFTGQLGYEMVQSFTKYPKLFGFEYSTEGAEGSFQWFDHPKIRIFRNTRKVSREELERTLTGTDPRLDNLTVEHLIAAQPGDDLLAQAGQATSRSTLFKRSQAASRASESAGAPSPYNSFPEKITPVGEDIRPPSRWAVESPAFWWMLHLEILALLLLPICYFVFPRLPDRGFVAAKVLGVVIYVYGSWLLVAAGLFENSRELSFIMVGLLAVAALFVGRYHGKEILGFLVSKWQMLLAFQVFYYVVFGAFIAKRMANPSLWMSEKPMDLSFTHTILRSATFPPECPWYAGYVINYYYFAHMTMAMLCQLTEITPHVGVNISMAMVPAQVAIVAFALVYFLSKRYWVALLSAVATVGFGQFSWIKQARAAKNLLVPSFDWWNAAHATIPKTINEFPFWSFLFSDPHAHVLVMPFFMVLLLIQYHMLVEGRSNFAKPWPGPLRYPQRLLQGFAVFGEGWRGLGLFAFATLTYGMMLPTNTWDMATHGSIFLILFVAIRFFKQGEGVSAFMAWLSLPWRAIQALRSGAGRALQRRTSTPVLSPAAVSYQAGLLRVPSLAEYEYLPTAFAPVESNTSEASSADAAPQESPQALASRFLGQTVVAVGDLFVFAVLPLLAMVVLSVFVLFHYYMQSYNPISYGVRAFTNPTSHELSEVLTIFACMFFSSYIYVFSLGLRRWQQAGVGFFGYAWRIAALPLSWLGLYFVGEWWAVAVVKYKLATYPSGWDEYSWTTFGFIMPFIWLAFAALFSRYTEARDRMASLIIILGLGVVAGVELVHIRDFMGDGDHRAMNTVFKFHLHGWLLLGPMVGYGLWRALDLLGEFFRPTFTPKSDTPPQWLEPAVLVRFGLFAAVALTVILLFRSTIAPAAPLTWLLTAIALGVLLGEAGLFKAGLRWETRIIGNVIAGFGAVMILGAAWWTPLAIQGKTKTHHYQRESTSVTGTLDGFAYKEVYDNRRWNSEYEAIRWLQKNVKGRQRILECIPDMEYYTEHMQVVMNTGLITLAGWNSHISQWNSNGGNIVERRRDARVIYEGTDLGDVIAALYKYNIRYIYIGRLEKQKYNNEGFKKFDRYKEFFNLRFKNEGVTIYEVIYRQADGSKGQEEKIVARSSDNVFDGSSGSEKAQLLAPSDITASPEGNYFVADTMNHRVQVYAADGKHLRSIGVEGEAEGQLRAPRGVAIDPEGNLHVADTLNDRVQVFASGGSFLRQYGAGELFWPSDIAFDTEGNAIVSDSGNSRVVVFSPSGAVLRSIGGHGRQPGQFRMPLSVVVGSYQPAAEGGDKVTALWVHDLGNQRLQAFSLPEGRALGAFPVGTSPAIARGYPFLALGPKDELYLTDPVRDTVDVYRNDGSPVRTLEAGTHNNNWSAPTGIYFSQQGLGAVVSSNDGKLVAYERIIGASMFSGGQGDRPGMFNEPRDLSIDRRGNVYISDFRNFRVQKYDENGEFLNGWGTGKKGEGDSEFNDPCGIAVSPDGATVYVADTWNGRIQVFTHNGKFLAKWEGFFAPRAVAVGPDGTVYVSDSGNAQIVRVHPDGRRLGTIGRRGKGPGELAEPIGLAVDADRVYVVDTWNQRVQVFSVQGTPLKQFPVPSWAEGDGFREPYLEVHGQYIYVTDPPKNRILRIDKETGALAQSTTHQGASGGALNRPMGIGIDKDGNVFVTDTWNHRVVRIPASSFRPL